jgi:hypothetical protein
MRRSDACKPWLRTVARLALVALLAVVGGLVAWPDGAAALPGDAAATGIVADLDITPAGQDTVQVDLSRGSVNSPPEGAAVLLGAAADIVATFPEIGLYAVVDADAVRTASNSTAAITNASAEVTAARIRIPGLPLGDPLVETDEVGATADCPTGGPATADVSPPTVLQVGGVDVILDVNGEAVVTLPDGTGTVGIDVDSVTTTTLNGAAVALVATIDVDDPETVTASGTVTLAAASCQGRPLVAPTATSLTPAFGPVSGGTAVTVTGSSFIPGGTSVTIGGITIPPAEVTVNDAGTTALFTTAAHAAGTVDVVVSTLGGSTAPLDFSYVPVPTAASLTPAAGPTAGGTEVTVSGTGFVAGETSLTIGGLTVSTAQVTVSADGTLLTFTTPAHAASTVDVVVSTPGGSTAPLDFSYVPVPTAASLTPATGPTAGGTEVTVSGTDFVAGQTTVTIGGITIPAGEVTVGAGGTSLAITTPAHAAGIVEVVVSTPGGSSGLLGFTYIPPPPTATSLAPAFGPTAGGTEVTVSGTDFVDGQTTVTIGGVTIPAGEVTVAAGGTSLTFTAPAHPAGTVDVVVTTTGGGTGPLDFSYVAAPVAATINPGFGPVVGGTAVTVTGTDFVAGQTTVTTGGVTIPAGEVTVGAGGTSLTYTTPAHAAGTVDIVVTTPGGAAPPLEFTYYPVPTASSLAPAFGPLAGGTAVTVTGTGFVAGQTTVTIGGRTIPAAEVTVNGTGTAARFTTPAHAAGTVEVVVTTPGGGPAGPLDFAYVPVPVVDSISPTSGPAEILVEIRGSGFIPGHTVVVVGSRVLPADEVTVGDEGTLLTFRIPSGSGTVDVVVRTPGGTTEPLRFRYAAGSGSLPGTGIDTRGLGALALSCLLAGGILVGLTRRRQRPRA